MGDGFLATFDGPARGIRCARAIADQVEMLGIEVRAGLHTGECELVGDDIGGMAVNIGARIGALAARTRCSFRAPSRTSSSALASRSAIAVPVN